MLNDIKYIVRISINVFSFNIFHTHHNRGFFINDVLDKIYISIRALFINKKLFISYIIFIYLKNKEIIIKNFFSLLLQYY
jgi:hypothetical protein